jgi:glyoxylase-like metal-dependent hydrolase (beta-lactamase superfamily II)
VSLWRTDDRTLIVGDAFITTKQESAYAVATQRPELHGPPMYFTPDWDTAGESVRRLAALEPELVITGHGRPLGGVEMRTALRHVLSQVRLEAVDAADEPIKPAHITLVPKHGARVVVRAG